MTQQINLTLISNLWNPPLQLELPQNTTFHQIFQYLAEQKYFQCPLQQLIITSQKGKLVSHQTQIKDLIIPKKKLQVTVNRKTKKQIDQEEQSQIIIPQQDSYIQLKPNKSSQQITVIVNIIDGQDIKAISINTHKYSNFVDLKKLLFKDIMQKNHFDNWRQDEDIEAYYKGNKFLKLTIPFDKLNIINDGGKIELKIIRLYPGGS